MDVKKMMQQAQQMQEKLQRQMAEMKISATAGGGMVIATVNGNKQLLTLQLDPEVVSKDDVEMLQDLILAAVNDAHRKVDEALAQQMQGMMGGLRLPGMS
jgi:DNA-binding YbaB/EbfC family protein